MCCSFFGGECIQHEPLIQKIPVFNSIFRSVNSTIFLLNLLRKLLLIFLDMFSWFLNSSVFPALERADALYSCTVPVNPGAFENNPWNCLVACRFAIYILADLNGFSTCLLALIAYWDIDR